MKNLIGNEWLEASNNETLEVINPATNTFIASIPNSTKEDINEAVKYAETAQIEWGSLSIYERGSILKKYVDLIEEEKEDLAKLLSAETGKPIKEAKIEIENIRTLVYGYVEKAKHLYGITIPKGIEKGKEKIKEYTERYPLGVIACILPFNFPVDTFHYKVPAALIMGNAVIVKPSKSSPLTVTKLVDLLREAGVKAGAIEIIHGKDDVGNFLAQHPKTHFISMTGSTESGIEIMQAGMFKKLQLSLSSNDVFILHEDGDIDLAIEETIKGRLYNAGQICHGPKRFLIHSSIKEQYIEKLIEKLKTLKVGSPEDPETQIGSLISEKSAIIVEKKVDETIKEGAKMVFGGHRKGAFYEPTILDEVTKDMKVAKNMEILGPIIPIIEYHDIKEAIEIANQSAYGLGGSIVTSNMKIAKYVVDYLECGSVVINGSSLYRSAEMPLEGWKYSMVGSEGIAVTLEQMSKIKTIVVNEI